MGMEQNIVQMAFVFGCTRTYYTLRRRDDCSSQSFSPQTHNPVPFEYEGYHQ